MAAAAKEGFNHMKEDLLQVVDDAQVAVQDAQSLRLSEKCRKALEEGWKRFQAAYTLHVMKEKDEELRKEATVQRRQHKRSYDEALEALEVYMESIEAERHAMNFTPRSMAMGNSMNKAYKLHVKFESGGKKYAQNFQCFNRKGDIFLSA